MRAFERRTRPTTNGRSPTRFPSHGRSVRRNEHETANEGSGRPVGADRNCARGMRARRAVGSRRPRAARHAARSRSDRVRSRRAYLFQQGSLERRSRVRRRRLRMQLKTRRNAALREIGTPLAAATCALLGQSAPAIVQAQELKPWDIDTSMLIYSESDGRVQDLSLNVWGRKELREDKFLGLTLAIDSLTGASPSGAMPANVVQTFTSPSGNSQYTVAPGAQALDTSFLDT